MHDQIGVFGWRREHGRTISSVLVVAMLLLLVDNALLAQTGTRVPRVNGLPNHRYPRIGVQQWGGAPAEWYAKYDLVDISIGVNTELARQIKALNPDIIIVPTSDWNAAAHIDNVPEPWALRNSSGQKLNLYFESDFYYDLTNFCPRVNGKRYNEYLPEWLATSGKIDFSVYDGVATDGIWSFPHTANGDIDLDRNGRNDFDEHGETWIENQFLEGINTVLANLRKMLPPNKVILVNSGGFHSWGWDYTNGLMNEDTEGIFGFGWLKGQYDGFMAQAPLPHIVLFQGQPNYNYPFTPKPSKNDFKLMRYLLGFALLGDGYLDFMDVESGEHYYSKYYDEFDLDLGYPTGAAQEIRPGVWARFFDLGAMIMNASGLTQTVTAGELQGQSGYAGPYYAFRGGQEPQHNHGKLFQSVTLWSQETQKDPDNPHLKIMHGDAIILLKKTKEVVTDIIIDNVDSGTSPAAPPAELTGGWRQECDNAGYFYTVRCANWMELWGYAWADRGSGEARATYRPVIGVAGFYEVFEWHGYFGSSPEAEREATNAAYAIRHSQGEKIVTVDQSQNYGRWNSLGTYFFNTGSGNYVSFSNNANGAVMADAVKFVFKGSDPNRDATPPAPPKGVKVSQ
jgi:hypothetical protein